MPSSQLMFLMQKGQVSVQEGIKKISGMRFRCKEVFRYKDGVWNSFDFILTRSPPTEAEKMKNKQVGREFFFRLKKGIDTKTHPPLL